ncbi:cell division protein FtsQ/DivIB [Parasutterella sp.]|uniref:cell division protein FtsQ/DivIB n=1 Tax=Parasutterella sp. TaxID=2049037 RepID=UPI003995A0BB
MRRWSASTFSLFADVFGVLFTLLILTSAVYWFVQRPVFLLKGVDVQVEGNKDAINVKDVAQVLDGHIHGNYFTADLSEIADQLKRIPWVRDVSIGRVWPNRFSNALPPPSDRRLGRRKAARRGRHAVCRKPGNCGEQRGASEDFRPR